MDNRFNNYNPFLEEDISANKSILKAEEIEKENEDLIKVVSQYNEIINNENLSTEENNELFLNFLILVLEGNYFIVAKCEEDDIFSIKYLTKIVNEKKYNNLGAFLSLENLSSFILDNENYLEEDESIIAIKFPLIAQIILNNDIIDGLTINPNNEDLFINKDLIKKLFDFVKQNNSDN